MTGERKSITNAYDDDSDDNEDFNKKPLFDRLRIFTLGLNGLVVEWSLKTLSFTVFLNHKIEFLPKPWWCNMGVGLSSNK